jgi:hypothetical protein
MAVTPVPIKADKGNGQPGLKFVFELGLLDVHVLEFAGFKDLPALQALNEFSIFVTRHDLHTGMSALRHFVLFRRY